MLCIKNIKVKIKTSMKIIVKRIMVALLLMSATILAANATLVVSDKKIINTQDSYQFNISLNNDSDTIERNLLVRVGSLSDRNFSDVINIGYKQLKNGPNPLSFEYKVNSYLKTGDYIFTIEGRDPVGGNTTEAGLFLSKLNIVNANFNQLDIKKCMVDIGGTKYTLGLGPDLEKDGEAYLVCDLATSTKESLHTNIKLYKRSIGGESVLNSENVKVENDSAQNILKIKLLTGVDPQSYTNLVSIFNDKNQKLFPDIGAHLVIRGMSGTIQDLAIKNENGITSLTGLITGPADNNDNAKYKTKLNGDFNVKIFALDALGNECVSSSISSATNIEQKQFSTPLDFSKCKSGEINITVKLNYQDKTLSEKTLQYTKALNDKTVYYIVVFLVIAMSIAFGVYTYKNFKKDKNLPIAMFLLLALFAANLLNDKNILRVEAETASRGPTGYGYLTWITPASCGAEGENCTPAIQNQSPTLNAWTTYDTNSRIITVSSESYRNRVCGNAGTMSLDAQLDAYANGAYIGFEDMITSRSWLDEGTFVDTVTHYITVPANIGNVSEIKVNWRAWARRDQDKPFVVNLAPIHIINFQAPTTGGGGTTGSAPTNGTCNTPPGGAFDYVPRCISGDPTQLQTFDNSTYTWICKGSNGGADSNCQVTVQPQPQSNPPAVQIRFN